MASARKDKKGRALYKGENEHAAGGYYYQYISLVFFVILNVRNIKTLRRCTLWTKTQQETY